MQSHSKETKFNYTTLQNCLKDQKVKILPTKLYAIVEQLEEDDSTVITEESSSSALNPQP